MSKIELDFGAVQFRSMVNQEASSWQNVSAEAIRNTGKRSKAAASRIVRQYLALSKKDVDLLMRVISEDDDKVILRVRHKPMSFPEFKAKQAYAGGKYKTSGNRKKAGFKVKIWKNKPAIHYKHSFRVDVPNSPHGWGVFNRKGKDRFPIVQKRGPSVANVLLWSKNELIDEMIDNYYTEFERAKGRKSRGY